MTGAQADCEATFGGAVYEMGRRAKIVGEIGMGTYGFESGWRATIAVFADQPVDGPVFAKFPDTRSQDDQFRTVGQCHACAVDCLVAQPCTVELVRIEMNDNLLQGYIHRF